MIMSIRKNIIAAAATLAIGAGTVFTTLPTNVQNEPGRSPHWPAVRAKYLETHGECAACGQRDHLQVHHCMPFSSPEGRSLELSPENFITLCVDGPGDMSCHFVFGHAATSWKHYNPNVREDAKRFREMIANAKLSKSK